LILADALISIAMNPLVFAAVDPALAQIRSRSGLARRFERRSDPLAELPMATEEKYLAGRRIGEYLAKHGIPCVVAETVALRDFSRAYARFGSTQERLATSISCPEFAR
jgi:monovalent cation:H+ antiporter-2, CPA2 family